MRSFQAREPGSIGIIAVKLFGTGAQELSAFSRFKPGSRESDKHGQALECRGYQ